MNCLQSGFEGFVRDKYTILPDTTERILATEVTTKWRSFFVPFIVLSIYMFIPLCLFLEAFVCLKLMLS